ncbi:ferritin-like domain-containing protein [Helicobacter cholecystus]|uniref:ferritin-like domain-containing protein n=1 Tax=Helicobacter cholecystus TaxID=45498 RepID=UPI002738D4DA|nr:ferritin-like domain-containing protein [Helicobacter cholecystus]
MELFSSLEEILHTPDIAKRFSLFNQLYNALHTLTLNHHHTITPITDPIYQSFCKVLHPTKISRSKTINTDSTMGGFLHSIAHIEYSAIDLALDASYRFRNLPLEYYHNWLDVAKEEIGHFNALRALLNACGYDYGDFPVHNNLFNAMKATQIFSHRMALVHRGMEAGGLDANPFVAQKVSLSSHHLKEKILHELSIILKDEISHVSKGDKWWKYSKDPHSFKEILKLYNYSLPQVLNTVARLQCGFTQEELQDLTQIKDKNANYASELHPSY